MSLNVTEHVFDDRQTVDAESDTWMKTADSSLQRQTIKSISNQICIKSKTKNKKLGQCGRDPRADTGALTENRQDEGPKSFLSNPDMFHEA